MLRTIRRSLAALVAVGVALVATGGPAGAILPDPSPRGVASTSAELVVSALGPGTGVAGAIAPAGFNPLAGYPPAGPPAGSTPANQSFAGIIRGQVPSTGAVLNMYCIDLLTPTRIGLGYQLGEWNEANVPNVGYVARLLNNYYPNSALPALANNNQRAAAVQASIWFLTDRYVLQPTDPLFAAVSGIVADVIAAGPVVQPPAPTVDISPASTSGPIGSLLGPFTVTSNQPSVTVAASVGELFSDAAGLVPVANGTAVPAGTQLWLRSSTAGPATVRGSVSTVVQSGTVYLYLPANPTNPNPADAQTLILAQQGTISTLDEAQVSFFDQGSLIVTKTISGNGAPFHGPITITVRCNNVDLEPFNIPAGTATDVSKTYGPLQTPQACVVTETVDGSVANVTVVVTGSGQTVVIPQNTDPDDSVTATIGDVYTAAPGSLTVRKTIQGGGAGQQGPITITIDCGAALQTTVVIPAGQTAPFEQTFDNLPAGTTCTVTETGGDIPAPLVASLEPPETVVIPPGIDVEVAFVNTFDPPATTTTTTTTTTTLPTTTTTPISPTSVSPTSVGPTTTGQLPDTGGGSLSGFALMALTVAGIGFVVLAWSRFPKLEGDQD